MRVGEERDTVLIESRGTLAFCFGKFKESCVCAYWYCGAVSGSSDARGQASGVNFDENDSLMIFDGFDRLRSVRIDGNGR